LEEKVVSRRLEGGREREKKREPAGNPRIPAGSVFVSGQRSGRLWVSAKYRTFRFRSDLSDVTDFVSRSRRPVLVAGRREKKKNEREREG
jgi:hypothetical protein